MTSVVNRGRQSAPTDGASGPAGLGTVVPAETVTPAEARTPAGTPGSLARRWRGRYVRALWCGDVVLLALVLVSVALVFDLGRLERVAAAAMGLLWIGLLAALGTRSLHRLGTGSEEYALVADAALICGALLAVAGVAVPALQVRALLFIGVPAGALATLVFRALARHRVLAAASSDAHLSRVVIVGGARDAAFAQRHLVRHGGVSYRVVGTVTEEASGKRIGPLSASVLECLRREEADAVLVAGPLRSGSNGLRELCWLMQEEGAELVLTSALAHVAAPRLRMRPVEGLPLTHVELPRFQSGHLLLKRCMDVAGAAAALLVLSPVFLWLALVIRRDSEGPVFFGQERIGLDRHPFRMLKFRTMVRDAEARRAELTSLDEGQGVLFKIKDDPRVTRCGRWMRRHSLDELPQFLNVLRGDMSLVGPRPPLPDEVQAYRGHTARRLNIKPGLTGLWQVSGRSDLDAEESERLDLYYVENWSLIGDVRIMWRTLRVMLDGSGGY